MKCNNCKDNALYIYSITDVYKQYYCKKHLPKFLEALRKAGNLETTDFFKQKAKSTLESLSTNKLVVEEPKVVVESEAVAEEVVEEPVVEELPKPRKKSKPKAELAEDEVNS